MKTRKITKTCEIGDEFTVFTIIGYEGLQEIKGRKTLTFDHFFEVKCKECGSTKILAQKVLKSSEKSKQRHCSACPPEIRRGIEKARQQEYDRDKRETKYDLSESDFELYKLALFKQRII